MSNKAKTMGAVKARLVELEAQLDTQLFGVRRGPNGELIEDEGGGISPGTAVKVGAIGVGAGGAGVASAPYLNRFRQAVSAGAPVRSAALAGVRSAGADAMAGMRAAPGAVAGAAKGMGTEAAFRGRLAKMAGSKAWKRGATGNAGILGRIGRTVKAATIAAVR